jgi:hypothetical protein
LVPPVYNTSPPVGEDTVSDVELVSRATKLALIVWLACTLLKVYVVTAPTDEPSTRTSDTLYPEFGVMVKVRLEPCDRITEPDGEMDPLLPADAVMV